MKQSQITEALILLRAISSDIEAMRDGDDFGPFESFENDEGTCITWPNLAITARTIESFLNSVKES